jgi:hypothetical protein
LFEGIRKNIHELSGPIQELHFAAFDERGLRREASEKSKITVRIAVADLIGTALPEVTCGLVHRYEKN